MQTNGSSAAHRSSMVRMLDWFIRRPEARRRDRLQRQRILIGGCLAASLACGLILAFLLAIGQGHPTYLALLVVAVVGYALVPTLMRFGVSLRVSAMASIAISFAFLFVMERQPSGFAAQLWRPMIPLGAAFFLGRRWSVWSAVVVVVDAVALGLLETTPGSGLMALGTSVATCFVVALAWVYERAWEEAIAQAEAASVAREQFVARVSHDLKTPLQAIIGSSELLMDTSLDAEQRELAEIGLASAETMTVLIADILDHARAQADGLRLARAPFDPRAVVEDTLRLLTAQAKVKGVELRSDVAEYAAGELLGDADRLRQVLTNLVANALRFTDDGHVTVRLWSRDEGDGTATLHGEVVDTGVGVSDESRGTLFEPWVQADGDRQRGGSGLGLAICREIIDRMGGRIGVRSSNDAGSTFWFRATLPKA